MNISVLNAEKVFSMNSNITKWIPKQNFKNAFVEFEKENDIINKIVTQRNGNKITGRFRNGELLETIVTTKYGEMIKTPYIKTSYGECKFTQFKDTFSGDTFLRRDYKNNDYTDYYFPKDGVGKSGKMQELYNDFRNLLLLSGFKTWK